MWVCSWRVNRNSVTEWHDCWHDCQYWQDLLGATPTLAGQKLSWSQWDQYHKHTFHQCLVEHLMLRRCHCTAWLCCDSIHTAYVLLPSKLYNSHSKAWLISDADVCALSGFICNFRIQSLTWKELFERLASLRLCQDKLLPRHRLGQVTVSSRQLGRHSVCKTDRSHKVFESSCKTAGLRLTKVALSARRLTRLLDSD